MFARDMTRLVDEMEKMLQRAAHHQRTRRGDDIAGHRVEIVDGEVTEEYLVDGDWMTLDEYREHKRTDDTSYDFRETNTQQSLTMDLSGEIRDGYGVAEASVNNGVLDVTFSMQAGESGEESDDE